MIMGVLVLGNLEGGQSAVSTMHYHVGGLSLFLFFWYVALLFNEPGDMILPLFLCVKTVKRKEKSAVRSSAPGVDMRVVEVPYWAFFLRRWSASRSWGVLGKVRATPALAMTRTITAVANARMTSMVCSFPDV
jgi:hypothetical protein